MSYLQQRKEHQEISQRRPILSPRSRDQINSMNSTMNINPVNVLREKSRNVPFYTHEADAESCNSLNSNKFQTLQMSSAQVKLMKMIRSKTKLVKENITHLVEGQYAESELVELRSTVDFYKAKNQELEQKLSDEKLLNEDSKNQMIHYQDKFMFLMQQTKVLEDQVENGSTIGKGTDDERFIELEDELEKSIVEKEDIIESVTQLKKEFEKKEKSYQALIKKSQLFVEHKKKINKIKEKQQTATERQQISFDDADTPEFAGVGDRKTSDLITDFEKTIVDIKRQHKEELSSLQLENLEKLKEAQETVSQVQIQQQETMDRIEELQRELARKELVASTIEDNQSQVKKGADEMFSPRTESLQNDENTQGPQSLNSSPCKGTKNLTPRYLATESSQFISDELKDLKEKHIKEMGQLCEKYELQLEEQRIEGQKLIGSLQQETQEKVENMQNAMYLAQCQNNKTQVEEKMVQTESIEVSETMIQTETTDSDDKNVQTDNIKDIPQMTQQYSFAPIETLDAATDKGENEQTTKGQDVIELNNQLQKVQDKMDRQQKVNGWLMEMIKEKGMTGILGLQ